MRVYRLSLLLYKGGIERSVQTYNVYMYTLIIYILVNIHATKETNEETILFYVLLSMAVSNSK